MLRLLDWREFRVKCFVRKELRLFEWKELRLLEWREFRVKCFVWKELRLLEWKELRLLRSVLLPWLRLSLVQSL